MYKKKHLFSQVLFGKSVVESYLCGVGPVVGCHDGGNIRGHHFHIGGDENVVDLPVRLVGGEADQRLRESVGGILHPLADGIQHRILRQGIEVAHQDALGICQIFADGLHCVFLLVGVQSKVAHKNGDAALQNRLQDAAGLIIAVILPGLRIGDQDGLRTDDGVAGEEAVAVGAPAGLVLHASLSLLIDSRAECAA